MMLRTNGVVAVMVLAFSVLSCSQTETLQPPTGSSSRPTRISDRGVQEHGKVWPRSIDSAYMGTWGDNRNSGSTLVTSFEHHRLAGQSEYLSWTQPNSPPVSALMTNGSTEAPNGLIIAVSPRGGGTSTVVALDLKGKVVWRTEEWTGEDKDGNGIPDQAGLRNAVASSAGIQAPRIDVVCAPYNCSPTLPTRTVDSTLPTTTVYGNSIKIPANASGSHAFSTTAKTSWPPTISAS